MFSGVKRSGSLFAGGGAMLGDKIRYNKNRGECGKSDGSLLVTWGEDCWRIPTTPSGYRRVHSSRELRQEQGAPLT